MLQLVKKQGWMTTQAQSINFLNEEQANAVTREFQEYYDEEKHDSLRKRHGRHWLIFLVLRYTGARLSEVLNLHYDDIDFRNAEIKLITLKRHNPRKKGQYRIVPVPANVVSEIATYIAQYPEQKDKLFQADRTVFYRVFREMCKRAGIPKELSHPHILRHTRAIELLKAGVPVTIVQDILGHSALTTTAIYLRMSGQEAKGILREKGLI